MAEDNTPNNPGRTLTNQSDIKVVLLSPYVEPPEYYLKLQKYKGQFPLLDEMLSLPFIDWETLPTKMCFPPLKCFKAPIDDRSPLNQAICKNVFDRSLVYFSGSACENPDANNKIIPDSEDIYITVSGVYVIAIYHTGVIAFYCNKIPPAQCEINGCAQCFSDASKKFENRQNLYWSSDMAMCKTCGIHIHDDHVCTSRPRCVLQ